MEEEFEEGVEMGGVGFLKPHCYLANGELVCHCGGGCEQIIFDRSKVVNIKKMKREFVDQLPDLNYCMIGLQGSRMLGLQQSEDADYDYRGVYVARHEELLSLNNKPKETICGGSSKDHEMDYVFHEVEKFFRLALKGNPSVVHLFFIPEYNLISDIGHEIVSNKNLFLSENAIRKAFGGYAMSQILYLKRNRGDSRRKEKHVRHCFRLFDSGIELLKTGNMTMPLKNPEYYISLGKLINKPGGLDKLVALFEEKDREFQSVKSTLAAYPNEYMANKLLLKIRGI